MLSIRDMYNEWLEKCTSEELIAELKAMSAEEAMNSFYKELEFGTAGLRGIIGAGTNKLNIHTIARATQGVADYVLSLGGGSVAVSYDSRIKSDLFARVTAEVLAANGIRTIITEDMMPTPYLSYMVRAYDCKAGVMITASHNPKEYNGYKVYGADGCQLTDNAAGLILEYIGKHGYFDVKRVDFDEAIRNGLIEYVKADVTEGFLDEVYKCGITHNAKGLKVTYSALNGTGIQLVPSILKKIGADVMLVEEQCVKDGNFPTCPYPNPEKRDALELGIKCLEANGSDLLIATDPDADRVGTAVIGKDGNARLLTGNEVGLLLAEYILSNKKDIKNPVVVKTIVTTKLTEKICKAYGAELRDVLTGFKYIGEQIALLEEKGEESRFVLGFEESYGYLAGSYVRDKDAVVASMLIAELAAELKQRGKTLEDGINDIYAKYGLENHRLLSYRFEGSEGSVTMKKVIDYFRNTEMADIGGYKVENRVDYLIDETGLIKANVLRYSLEGGAQVILRPSGTEPLIKAYVTVCGESFKDNAQTLYWLCDDLNAMVEKFR